MTDYLHRIPMAELHVHLRGMLQPDVFMELMMKHGKSRPWLRAPARHREIFNRCSNIADFIRRTDWNDGTIESLFRFRTFDQFLATWCFTGYLIRDIDDFTLLVHGALDYLNNENVTYAEITVSPSEYLSDEVCLPELIEILDSVSSQSPVHVQWIFDLVRDNGPKRTGLLLNDIMENHANSIVGITLGGTEHRFPPAQYKDIYREAGRKGLRLTVHAGESLGPESVWDAIKLLGVDRIGHGVRAVEDPELMNYLAEHQIPLEICPTSNICTGLYDSYEEHPMKMLFDHGIPITVNSDDPAFFKTTVHTELFYASSVGFSGRDLLQIVMNGFRYAFIDDELKQSYTAGITDLFTML